MNTITDKSIDITLLLEQAHDPDAGGIVLFSGEVRNSHAGKKVTHLLYEAHISLAEKTLQEILLAAKEKWQLRRAFAVHRIGQVGISESAVVVITSHTHRDAAYQANQYIIDRIKYEAPIWKCECFEDGTHEWGGDCDCFAVAE